MQKVMIQFHFDGDEPDIQEVARRLAIEPDQIDSEFGVIATDPDAGLYTILVEAEVGAKVQSQLDRDNDEAVGEFSNPRIEPFGPPED